MKERNSIFGVVNKWFSVPFYDRLIKTNSCISWIGFEGYLSDGIKVSRRDKWNFNARMLWSESLRRITPKLIIWSQIYVRIGWCARWCILSKQIDVYSINRWNKLGHSDIISSLLYCGTETLCPVEWHGFDTQLGYSSWYPT